MMLLRQLSLDQKSHFSLCRYGVIFKEVSSESKKNYERNDSVLGRDYSTNNIIQVPTM